MSQRRLLLGVAIAVTALMILSPVGSALLQGIGVTPPADLMDALGASFLDMFHEAVAAGPMPQGSTIGVSVDFPLQNQAELSNLIEQVSTPGSPNFRHFITPEEFQTQFAPSAASYLAAEKYFQGYGLTVTPSSDRLILAVSGSSSSMGAAFHTSFEDFLLPGDTVDYGPTLTPTLPSSLGASGAFGFTSATFLKPTVTTADIVPATPEAAQTPSNPAACTTGTGSTTSGYTPCQIEAVYGTSTLLSAGHTGAGEQVAIVDAYDPTETQTDLASDISTFSTDYALPAATVNYEYPEPLASTCNSTAKTGGCYNNEGWGGEEVLDMDWVHAQATGATEDMTLAPNSGAGLYEDVNALVSEDVPNVISLSWGEPITGVLTEGTTGQKFLCSIECNASTDGSLVTLHPVLEAAAAEGISVFVASGDCGADDGTSSVATDYPASDEDATGIGGTVLTASGTTYTSETAWAGNESSCSGNDGGAGGGWAPQPQPWYQTGTGIVNKGLRGVPDVGITVGSWLAVVQGGTETVSAGTSDGAPQWAGLTAIADQIHGGDVGLINPDLYAMLRSPSYSTYFHDITSGSNGYSAGTGWDPVTGVGTPYVANAIPYIGNGGYTVTNNPISVTLSASATSGTAPLTVTFTATATGGTGTYPYYDFSETGYLDSNATHATKNTATYTYNRDGSYVAQVEVFDSSGNSSTSAPILINVGNTVTGLSVTLAASTATPSVHTSDTFTATATGGTSPYTYMYVFGDGAEVNDSSLTSIGHAYGADGTYCAYAFAFDSASPFATAESAPVTINVGGSTGSCSSTPAPLTGSITSNRSSATVGMPISFSSSVSGGTPSYTYAWTFGDSTTATTANPAHAYTATGTYHVDLNVSDSASHTVQTNGLTITVTAIGAALAVTASASTTTPTTGQSVTFTASASGGTGTYTAYAWTFGDGNTGTGATTTHSYSATGTYSVTVKVTDSSSATATSSPLSIVVSAGAGNPTVSITSNRSSATVGELVSFTSTVTGGTPAYTYAWTFGDSGTSTVADPTHGYSATGTYSVSVVVTDSLSHTGTSNSLSITVTAVGASLAITATGTPLTGSSPLTVTFTSTPSGGTGSYTAFLWNFGDGATATTQDTSHTYVSGGNFLATVTVTDSSSKTATSSDLSVTVTETGLSVVASVSPGSGAVGSTFTFSATASGGSGTYTEYKWIFGDGATGSGQSATHVYTAANTYEYTVTVTDSSDAQAISSPGSVSVTAASVSPLQVSLTASSTSGSVGTPVTFTATASQGTAPYTYLWSGLPAGCSSANSPTNDCTPTTAADYYIQVTVSDSSATTQTVTKGIFYNVTSGTSQNSSPNVLGLSPTDAYLLLAVVAIAAVAVIAAVAYHRRSRKDMEQQPPMDPYQGAPGSYYPPQQ